MNNARTIAEKDLSIAFEALKKHWTPDKLKAHLANDLRLSNADFRITFDHVAKLMEIYSDLP